MLPRSHGSKNSSEVTRDDMAVKDPLDWAFKISRRCFMPVGGLSRANPPRIACATGGEAVE
jgi:hypothetical protein